MKKKLTPAEAATKAKLEAVIAEVGPPQRKRARPARALEAGGTAFLEQGNLDASAACLRELQRRRGPLGLNPLGERDTVH